MARANEEYIAAVDRASTSYGNLSWPDTVYSIPLLSQRHCTVRSMRCCKASSMTTNLRLKHQDDA